MENGLWYEYGWVHYLLSTAQLLLVSNRVHRMSKGKASPFAAEGNALFITPSLFQYLIQRNSVGVISLPFLPIFLSLFLLYFLLGISPFFILLLPPIPSPASAASWLHFYSFPSAKMYSCIMYQMLTFIMLSIRFWVKAWIETSKLCRAFISHQYNFSLFLDWRKETLHSLDLLGRFPEQLWWIRAIFVL